MKDFEGKVAVITGAASGFGREFARLGARRGMKLVLADIQADALEATVAELRAAGADVSGERVDVSRADEVERLAESAFARHGQVNLLFNNAGVATGGLLWENTQHDWEWVLGVNLWSVIHGVRAFVPRMIAQRDDSHVINTASVAGLLAPPAMGVYNVSKHAVVALSESLYQDLRTARSTLGVSVLCPAFVPTGINESERNRPQALGNATEPTESMRAVQATLDKAVRSGRISAADVAGMTFDAIEALRFYVITHPNIMGSIRLRFEDIAQQRNPSDPYALKPELARHD